MKLLSSDLDQLRKQISALSGKKRDEHVQPKHKGLMLLFFQQRKPLPAKLLCRARGDSHPPLLLTGPAHTQEIEHLGHKGALVAFGVELLRYAVIDGDRRPLLQQVIEILLQIQSRKAFQAIHVLIGKNEVDEAVMGVKSGHGITSKMFL